MTQELWKTSKEGIFIKVKVCPNSSKDEIAGILGDSIKIRVSTPPEEGKANARLIELMSKEFQIPKKDIEIVKGHSSPNKILLLKNIKELKINKK